MNNIFINAIIFITNFYNGEEYYNFYKEANSTQFSLIARYYIDNMSLKEKV